MRRSQKKPMCTTTRILKAINAFGRGSVFVPTDFLDFGSRGAIDIALHRLVQEGTIRRLARGIYDFPKKHPQLGFLQPSPRTIAEAIVERDCTHIQPTGAYAANILGLSEQVPAKVVFLTDGPNRKLKIGPITIQLRQTTQKNMATAGRLSGLLIQALRELGKENITTDRCEHLKRTLPADKRRELLNDIKFAPGWMHPIFKKLAEDDE